MAAPQSSQRIIMIRPASFAFNVETAVSNAFQDQHYAALTSAGQLQRQAVLEFDRMVEQLRAHGVHVDVFDDTPLPVKPDAVFPNNWFSTHLDGTIIVYSMLAANRRLERRDDLIKALAKTHQVNAVIDLSVHELHDRFLEGTGSLTLDHRNRIVYAVRSPRTNDLIVEQFTKLMNFHQPALIFDSVDSAGKPIYHTNVMMAIGTRVAVICLASIPDGAMRERVARSLEQNGTRVVIDITFEQMSCFAGNMLELRSDAGDYLLAMSKSAYDALTGEQRSAIGATNTKLISFDVSTIERCGGGSVRCMIAENFLTPITS